MRKITFYLCLFAVPTIAKAQLKTTSQRETIHLDSLSSSRTLDVNLNGTNVPIGMWESFLGNAALVDTASSPDLFHVRNIDSGTFSAHATQVATILTSKGVSSPSMMGAAPAAEVYVSDVDYPYGGLASEMANEISAYQLLVSNHSYSESAGWVNDTFWYGLPQISDVEDYKFGYYGDLARTYDSIAEAFPYHTIVKAVGNDRGTVFNPSYFYAYHFTSGAWSLQKHITPTPIADGGTLGYDGLSPGATSKNALVVGAVKNIADGYSSYTDVDFGASGSQWGPTDDGRIKPDVVSPGETSYGLATSYAVPMVSGTIALLQEYHQSLYGTWMTSAMVKALLIHTADSEASNGGPSARAGYGLINAYQAALALKNPEGEVHMIEGELSDGEEDSFRVYLDGTVDFVATLSWTDPKGNSPTIDFNSSDLDDPTAILVHDLDIALLNSSSITVGSPWKIDVDNPSNAATRGINHVDNLERINLSASAISPGWYTVRISYTGNLSSAQKYSLIIGNAGGINFTNGSWSVAPSSWGSGELIVVDDMNTIATISEDVMVGSCIVKPGSRLLIQEGNTLTTSSEVVLAASEVGKGYLKGQVVGNVRFQVYIDGAEGYRYLSSPVKSTLREWSEDFYRLNTSSSSSPSVYGWDAANGNWIALSLEDSLHESGGLVAYFGSNPYGKFTELPMVKDVAGSLLPRYSVLNLQTDNNSNPSDGNLGWNLVSNPFTAPIDGQALDLSGTGGSWYIWDNDQGAFASSDGTNHVLGASRYIAPGQSFWLYCPSTHTGVLTLDSASSVLDVQAPYFKSQEGIRLKWYMSDGSRDEVVLRLTDEGNSRFLFNEDRPKKWNGAFGYPDVHLEIDGVDCVYGEFSNRQTDSVLIHWNSQELNVDSVVAEGTWPATAKVSWVKSGREYGWKHIWQQSDWETSEAIWLKWEFATNQGQNAHPCIEVNGHTVRYMDGHSTVSVVIDMEGREVERIQWGQTDTYELNLVPGVYFIQTEGCETLKFIQ